MFVWLIGWLADWWNGKGSVAGLQVVRLFGCLVGWWIDWLFGWLVGKGGKGVKGGLFFNWLVDQSFG